MELPTIVERSSRQHPQSPWGRNRVLERERDLRPSQGIRRRLLCLPLAGLIMLVLVGCVSRQASSNRKTLRHSDSTTSHNLNRGRVRAHHRNNEDHN